MDSNKNSPALAALLLLSVVILGFVVGMLVGRSGPDPTVVAALVPAILTAAGYFVILKSEHHHPVIGPICLILFALTLFWAASIGSNTARSDNDNARLEHYKNCSDHELITNFYRESLGLPRLKSAVFCDYARKE